MWMRWERESRRTRSTASLYNHRKANPNESAAAPRWRQRYENVLKNTASAGRKIHRQGVTPTKHISKDQRRCERKRGRTVRGSRDTHPHIHLLRLRRSSALHIDAFPCPWPCQGPRSTVPMPIPAKAPYPAGATGCGSRRGAAGAFAVPAVRVPGALALRYYFKCRWSAG